jgi:hypothetical protein
MNKPKIISVKEKKFEEKKPPSEEEYEFLIEHEPE